MDWYELTDEEREEYVSQDVIDKDDRILYVGGNNEIDWLRMHKSTLSYQQAVHDFELGEEEIEVIKKCGLTERQEECIIMYYVDGMSERAIGEKLGISQRVVSQHIEYGRKKIWKELKYLAGDYYVKHNERKKE